MLTGSFLTNSSEETFQLGELVGQKAQPGDVWRLEGPLGAGKTAFVKGMAQGLGFPGQVQSPTFSLQNIYEGRLNLYHFDWYRLDSPLAVEELGWREWLGRGGVVAVEWGDKFAKLFPAATIRLQFEFVSEETRRLIVEAKDPAVMPRVEELLLCWPL